MALLIWNDSFSVGVKEIDAQHQKIYEMINLLYAAMVDMKEGEMIDKLISDLVEYADYHFSTEEKYFDKFGYEDSEVHRARHEDYKVKVEGFKSAAEKDGTLSREILTFLEDWWIHHIMIADKKYTDTFHAHGLN